MAAIEDIFVPDKQKFYPSVGNPEGGEAPVQQAQTEEILYPSLLPKEKKIETPWNVNGSTQQKEPAAPVQKTQDPAPQRMSYEEMYEQMSPYAPDAAEDEKRLKRQARDERLARVGSALSAFNVAYANAAGTKPMVDPSASLTGRVRERYERLKKERDARAQEYMNGYINAVKMDEADRLANIKSALEVRRQDRLDRETKIKEDKAAAYQQYQASVAAKNDELAAYWKAKWEALEAGKDLDRAIKEAEAAQKNATARLNNVRAYNGGYAPQRGYTQTTTKDDGHGGQTTMTVTKTPAGGSNGNNTSNKTRTQL